MEKEECVTSEGDICVGLQPGVCTDAADQLPVTPLRHPLPYI